MRKVSEYEQHAAECLEMARRATDPHQKARLIEMADAWTMLANQRAAQETKQSANGATILMPRSDCSDATNDSH
jgi:hypothetical protein